MPVRPVLRLPVLGLFGLWLLAFAVPALAEGAPKPPGRGLHAPACRPVQAAPHPRSSDVPMRGDRAARLPPCSRRPGPLHHLFHGHRR